MLQVPAKRKRITVNNLPHLNRLGLVVTIREDQYLTLDSQSQNRVFINFRSKSKRDFNSQNANEVLTNSPTLKSVED